MADVIWRKSTEHHWHDKKAGNPSQLMTKSDMLWEWCCASDRYCPSRTAQWSSGLKKSAKDSSISKSQNTPQLMTHSIQLRWNGLEALSPSTISIATLRQAHNHQPGGHIGDAHKPSERSKEQHLKGHLAVPLYRLGVRLVIVWRVKVKTEDDLISPRCQGMLSNLQEA